jgi:hypothetical protein
VERHYKHREPNDLVINDDKVVFKCSSGGQALHPSASKLPDSDCHEVNAAVGDSSLF